MDTEALALYIMSNLYPAYRLSRLSVIIEICF